MTTDLDLALLNHAFRERRRRRATALRDLHERAAQILLSEARTNIFFFCRIAATPADCEERGDDCVFKRDRNELIELAVKLRSA